MTSSKPNHFLKVPPPNIIIGDKVLAHAFWGNENIEYIVSSNWKMHLPCDLRDPGRERARPI